MHSSHTNYALTHMQSHTHQYLSCECTTLPYFARPDVIENWLKIFLNGQRSNKKSFNIIQSKAENPWHEWAANVISSMEFLLLLLFLPVTNWVDNNYITILICVAWTIYHNAKRWHPEKEPQWKENLEHSCGMVANSKEEEEDAKHTFHWIPVEKEKVALQHSINDAGHWEA